MSAACAPGAGGWGSGCPGLGTPSRALPGRAPGPPAGSQRQLRRPRAWWGAGGGIGKFLCSPESRSAAQADAPRARGPAERAPGRGGGAQAGGGVCARGARLDARPSERRVWRRRRWWRGLERRGRGLGERRGRGEPGSGEKLASAWVRSDGAGGGERGALRPRGDAGLRAAGGSESPVAALGRAGRRPRRS